MHCIKLAGKLRDGDHRTINGLGNQSRSLRNSDEKELKPQPRRLKTQSFEDDILSATNTKATNTRSTKSRLRVIPGERNSYLERRRDDKGSPKK